MITIHGIFHQYCPDFLVLVLFDFIQNFQFFFRLYRILVSLCERICLGYYSRSMTGVTSDMEKLSQMMEVRAPDALQHMEDLGVPLGMFSAQWLLCLFSDTLPAVTVFRIWDVMFLEGKEFILWVALVLLLHVKDAILSCVTEEEVIILVKDEPLRWYDADLLIQQVRSEQEAFRGRAIQSQERHLSALVYYIFSSNALIFFVIRYCVSLEKSFHSNGTKSEIVGDYKKLEELSKKRNSCWFPKKS